MLACLGTVFFEVCDKNYFVLRPFFFNFAVEERTYISNIAIWQTSNGLV